VNVRQRERERSWVPVEWEEGCGNRLWSLLRENMTRVIQGE
jgi:hypothetical protein